MNPTSSSRLYNDSTAVGMRPPGPAVQRSTSTRSSYSGYSTGAGVGVVGTGALYPVYKGYDDYDVDSSTNAHHHPSAGNNGSGLPASSSSSASNHHYGVGAYGAEPAAEPEAPGYMSGGDDDDGFVGTFADGAGAYAGSAGGYDDDDNVVGGGASKNPYGYAYDDDAGNVHSNNYNADDGEQNGYIDDGDDLENNGDDDEFPVHTATHMQTQPLDPQPRHQQQSEREERQSQPLAAGLTVADSLFRTRTNNKSKQGGTYTGDTGAYPEDVLNMSGADIAASLDFIDDDDNDDNHNNDYNGNAHRDLQGAYNSDEGPDAEATTYIKSTSNGVRGPHASSSRVAQNISSQSQSEGEAWLRAAASAIGTTYDSSVNAANTGTGAAGSGANPGAAVSGSVQVTVSSWLSRSSVLRSIVMAATQDAAAAVARASSRIPELKDAELAHVQSNSANSVNSVNSGPNTGSGSGPGSGPGPASAPLAPALAAAGDALPRVRAVLASSLAHTAGLARAFARLVRPESARDDDAYVDLVQTHLDALEDSLEDRKAALAAAQAGAAAEAAALERELRALLERTERWDAQVASAASAAAAAAAASAAAATGTGQGQQQQQQSRGASALYGNNDQTGAAANADGDTSALDASFTDDRSGSSGGANGSAGGGGDDEDTDQGGLTSVMARMRALIDSIDNTANSASGNASAPASASSALNSSNPAIAAAAAHGQTGGWSSEDHSDFLHAIAGAPFAAATAAAAAAVAAASLPYVPRSEQSAESLNTSRNLNESTANARSASDSARGSTPADSSSFSVLLHLPPIPAFPSVADLPPLSLSAYGAPAAAITARAQQHTPHLSPDAVRAHLLWYLHQLLLAAAKRAAVVAWRAARAAVADRRALREATAEAAVTAQAAAVRAAAEAELAKRKKERVEQWRQSKAAEAARETAAKEAAEAAEAKRRRDAAEAERIRLKRAMVTFQVRLVSLYFTVSSLNCSELIRITRL